LSKPDAGALLAAIRSVLETPSIRAQAQKLADEIAAMPAIERAVDQLLEIAFWRSRQPQSSTENNQFPRVIAPPRNHQSTASLGTG
jgi:hypothetical protein